MEPTVCTYFTCVLDSSLCSLRLGVVPILKNRGITGLRSFIQDSLDEKLHGSLLESVLIYRRVRVISDILCLLTRRLEVYV